MHRRTYVWAFAGAVAALILLGVVLILSGAARLLPAQSMLSDFEILWRQSKEVIPVAVVIENSPPAREHHAGLNEALLVEEWMVEGLITRFVAIFDSANVPPKIGPVRSLRPYFVTGVNPWSRVFIFAGGSPEAFDLVYFNDELEGFNGLAGQYSKGFKRDPEAAAPHNLFLSGAYLQLLGGGASAIAWPPYETGRLADGSGATVVDIDFHSPVHNVTYRYDAELGTYDRTNGYTEHQAAPVNVLVLEIPIVGVGEVGRLDIPVDGDGPAMLFTGGKRYEGTWAKTPDTVWIFTLSSGETMKFQRGQTWMTVIPSFERLEWSDGVTL